MSPAPVRAHRAHIFAAVLGALVFSLSPIAAEGQLTTPEEQFGFQIGADYQLINYEQLTEYWNLLASQSDRMTLRSIGTHLGRT